MAPRSPLCSSQVPFHQGDWHRAAEHREGPARGSCISTGRWAKVTGDPMGASLWARACRSSPRDTFLAPFSSLVWVLWAGTTHRAWHRGVSPSLEPAGTTPTQRPRGDESIRSTRLIHDTAASQTHRQKRLSLPLLTRPLMMILLLGDWRITERCL